MSDDIIKVSASKAAGMNVNCDTGEFAVVLTKTDDTQPADVDMNPMQMLLTSLAACECYVAEALAKMNNIDLKDIKVEITGEKLPREEQGKNLKFGYQKISTKFHVTTSNNAEEVEKFIRLVEKRCPVRATLVDSPEFESDIILN